MESLDLLGIELQDFRSIVDRMVLKLPRRGVYAIRGRNAGTGGSSRVGKSSINLGISYALGYCPFPGTELQSWFTDASPRVDLAVQTPGHRLDIHRGAKFSLDVDGVAVKGGARAAEAELVKHLGMTPAMLAALTYREQGSKGTFLSKTNVEVQEFFTEVLALEPYEQAAAAAAKNAETAEAVVVEKRVALQYLRQDLAQKTLEFEANKLVPADGPGCGLGYALQDLETLQAQQDAAAQDVQAWATNKDVVAATRKAQEQKCQATKDERLQVLNADARARDAEASALEAQASGLAATLERVRRDINSANVNLEADERALKAMGGGPTICPQPTLAAYLELATALEKSVQEQRDLIAEVRGKCSSAQLALESKRKALEAARGSTSCSACGRPYDNAAGLEARVQALQGELEAQQSVVDAEAEALAAAEKPLAAYVSMSKCARLAARVASTQADLADVLLQEVQGAAAHRALVAQAQEVRAVAQGVYERASAVRAEVDASFRENFQALDRAGAEASTRWENARDALYAIDIATGSAREHNERARENLRKSTQGLKDLEKGLQKAQDELAVAEATQAQERDFGAMVGREGFLGAIFDEVLAEVAEETNAILARVPNVADVTLAFRSETVTAKGTTKRGITPVVTIGGHEAPLKSGCSGGMLGAVYLATDLAVIDVVSRRLGVSPGWLVLDESFEGLGPVEKEGYLEVLDVYAQKKLVLIVDHSTETREAVSAGVNLVYENGRTRLERLYDAVPT